MGIGAAHTVEEFIADGLAGDGRAGVEDFLHRGAAARRRGVRGEPVRIAAAGALAYDIIHVLHHRAQPGERPARRALDWRLEVVGNEAAAISLRRHASISCIFTSKVTKSFE